MFHDGLCFLTSISVFTWSSLANRSILFLIGENGLFASLRKQ
jgi:hypothetical protein